jgi:hypothetical protein
MHSFSFNRLKAFSIANFSASFLVLHAIPIDTPFILAENKRS